MSTNPLKSGFFNSLEGDRVYDAEDFSEYLKGIIGNGCFPNDTGFKVFPNTESIGGNPPSVIINPGKAYYDGMWALNKYAYVFYMGTAPQLEPNMRHLIYLRFDTNVEGRTVTIECITDSNPVLPQNGSGMYYMPLALVYDRQGAQPTMIDGSMRPYAGVAGVSVNTPSIADEAITEPKLGYEAVTNDKVKSINGSKIESGSLPMNASTWKIFGGTIQSENLAMGHSATLIIPLPKGWSQVNSIVCTAMSEHTGIQYMFAYGEATLNRRVKVTNNDPEISTTVAISYIMYGR